MDSVLSVLSIFFIYSFFILQTPVSQTRWGPQPAGKKLQKSGPGRKKWPKLKK